MDHVTSYSLLQAVARHQSLLNPTLPYMQCLESAAKAAGFRNLATAKALLPETERLLCQSTLHLIDRAPMGTIRSGQFVGQIHTHDQPLLLAHMHWLLTGGTLTAYQASQAATAAAKLEIFTSLRQPDDSVRITAEVITHLVQIGASLGGSSASLERSEPSSTPPEGLPYRHDIRIRDGQVFIGDLTQALPSDGDAEAVLNLFVPPFHDGLPAIQTGPQTYVSATAASLAAPFLEALDGLKARQIDIAAKDLIDWIRQRAPAYSPHQLRCTDSLAVFPVGSSAASTVSLNVQVARPPLSLEVALLGQNISGSFTGRAVAATPQFHAGMIVIGIAEKDVAGWTPTGKKFPSSAYDEANEFADALNHDLGITASEATLILISSMTAGRTGGGD